MGFKFRVTFDSPGLTTGHGMRHSSQIPAGMPAPPAGDHDGHAPEDAIAELKRLRDENRRLAVSLGGFSAFLAERGLLEEAWQYVHRIHEQDDGDGYRAA